MKNFLPFLVVGITAGSVYGLAGLGLVLTYRTSGVFNFAHGALATAGSYVFYDLWASQHVPWPLAAAASVAGLGLLFGIGLERLARNLSSAPPAVIVVATIGLLLGIEGIISAHYGPETQLVKSFLPTSTFRLPGVNVGWDQLVVVVTGIGASAALALTLARTRIGTAMRAVVDDPDLLEITGFDATVVRRAAWILGGAVAVLSGILIAPTIGLNPLLLSYLVVQAFGAAAIGRFRSLPGTFAGGLILGVVAALGQKYTTNFPVLLGLPASVPFIVLMVVLVASRPGSLPGAGVAKRPRLDRLTPLPALPTAALGVVAAAVVLAIPTLVGARLPVYTSAAAYVIVFLSLGLLVKTAGQISLCHAAFVAVGAVAFSRIAGAGVPWPLALVGAGLATVPVGILVSLPAVRLSGVYLALATFAFGLLMENLVYRTFLMFGLEGHRLAPRPTLAALALSGDRGYFFVAVALAGMVALAIAALQRSRLGRLLAARADSPAALGAFGANGTTLLVLVFSFSAFFAGVAGAVLASGNRAAGPAGLGSLQSLLWIAVLAVSGNRLTSSAVVAAALLAVIPAYLPQSWQNYQPIAFGVIAVAAALLAAARFDWVAAVKADLARSPRRVSGGPARARMTHPWTSPVASRSRPDSDVAPVTGAWKVLR